MKTTFSALQEQYHEVESRINEHAEQLKQALGELEALVARTAEDYISPDGCRYSEYDITSMAERVKAIAQSFNNK